MNTPSSGGWPDEDENSRFFAKLADTFREKGDLDKAVEILNRGLAESPDHITARIILAACLKEKGDFDGAYREYLQILEIDPFHTAAMKKAGILLLDMGKTAEGKNYLTRYLEDLPGDADVRKLLESLEKTPVENTDREKVETDVAPEVTVDDKKNLVPSEEDELIATMTLAEIYASQGFYDKAIEIYRKILIKEPTNEIAKKRIEAIKRGDVIEKGKAAKLVEESKRVDHTGGGAPGEIIVDDEYESFKKWLVGLTKKKRSDHDKR